MVGFANTIPSRNGEITPSFPYVGQSCVNFLTSQICFLAMLLTLTIATNCLLRNKAIGIIHFAKSVIIFIDDTMIGYLNSKLDFNLSCAKDFRNLNSMVTWCID